MKKPLRISGLIKSLIMRFQNAKLSKVLLICIGLTGCATKCVKDIDGNSYRTITIGTQTWMAENLKTTRYNDGTAIPLVSDGTAWRNLSTPAYCWYDNDATNNKSKYGALYNWFTINTVKLCPQGWHIPWDADWTTLTDYLGGESVAGGKLKQTGTINWRSPNVGATNETRFTALPGGIRTSTGNYQDIGNYGNWWSRSAYSSLHGYFWLMSYDYSSFPRLFNDKQTGYSVRCIQN